MKRIYIGKAPEKFVYDSFKMAGINKRENRARLIDLTNNNKFKYYCAVCLIIRDENEYLEEWLKWHIGLGVEHFYIYDHGSKCAVKDFIKTLGGEINKKITVIDWSGKHVDAQPDAYNDCLNRFRGESRWIPYIDTDEQINIKTGQSLQQFLKNYEDYAGLFSIWVIYGANGNVKYENKPLRQRFTTISHGDAWSDSAGKIILQPMYVKEMMIHNGYAEEGFEIIDEYKRPIKDYKLTSLAHTTDLICIDHYYTKSYEEWLTKLHRGSCHANFMRKYEEFFKVNPDMAEYREDINIIQEYENFD